MTKQGFKFIFLLMASSLLALKPSFAAELLTCDFTIHKDVDTKIGPLSWKAPIDKMTGSATVDQTTQSYRVQAGVMNGTFYYSNITDQKLGVVAETIPKDPSKKVYLSIANLSAQWAEVKCEIKYQISTQ